MKKILLSAVAVFALGTAAQAQDINFGVKAGANFSTIASDNDEGIGTRTGFHVGAIAEFKFSDTFSLQPELVYSMMGSSYDFGGDSYDTKLDYITIPVVAKYYVFEGFDIEAGPQVGFLASAKEEDTDAKDFYKSVDFGVTAGVGYALPMGVFFQARYYIGLSDIYDIPDDVEEAFGESSANNYSIQLSVGYKF